MIEFSQDQFIFVFGSNTAGRHGKGAAAFARRYYGAVAGQGEGAQGRAYAIPTKDGELQTLPLETIARSIQRFVRYAAEQPEHTFQVTRIGCGLAGYRDEEILPLFTAAGAIPKNCLLPGVWIRRFDPTIMRVIVAGGRDYGERDGEYDRMLLDLAGLRAKHRGSHFEIVSGGARGAGARGEFWARAAGVPVTRFPADWRRYEDAAGFVRNQVMAWYGTHLVAYWNGCSKGTSNMIELARAGGLPRWIRRYGEVAVAAPQPDDAAL